MQNAANINTPETLLQGLFTIRAVQHSPLYHFTRLIGHGVALLRLQGPPQNCSSFTYLFKKLLLTVVFKTSKPKKNPATIMLSRDDCHAKFKEMKVPKSPQGREDVELICMHSHFFYF